jgi:hypothetical protein
MSAKPLPRDTMIHTIRAEVTKKGTKKRRKRRKTLMGTTKMMGRTLTRMKRRRMAVIKETN